MNSHHIILRPGMRLSPVIVWIAMRPHHIILPLGVRLSPVILLLMLATNGHAQRAIPVEVQAWANIRLATLHDSWDAGGNGGGISVGITTALKHNIRVTASGEAGAAGVGNYAAGKAGIGVPITLGASKWAYTPGFSLLQGMTLSRPNPLYMWGVEQTNVIGLRVKNESGPGLVIGFRLYGFPGYDRYSKIRTFFDLRAGVRYNF